MKLSNRIRGNEALHIKMPTIYIIVPDPDSRYKFWLAEIRKIYSRKKLQKGATI